MHSFLRISVSIAIALPLAGCVRVGGDGSQAALDYPVTQQVAQVDDYHGVAVADPYRWLEQLTSAETQAWVDAQNNVSLPYLSSLPTRDYFADRLGELIGEIVARRQ